MNAPAGATGGMLISVLAYPIFWGLLAYDALMGRAFHAPQTALETWVLMLTSTNLVLGFTAHRSIGR